MARSDLLVSLVKAGARGDASAFRSTVDAISAEARARSHNVLADRLDTAVQARGAVTAQRAAPAVQRHEALAAFEPRVELDDLLLPPAVRRTVDALVEEQLRADLLRAHGLQPRHRVLLCGPPGNGKTSLAEALAAALGVAFFVVQYDALVGSYLGVTNARLARLLDEAAAAPCVVLFDEFEAVGKERGDYNETGEMKRVVASLLTRIDALPSHVVVVGATNHPEMLDRAVWRRFQAKLELPSPSTQTLAEFVAAGLGADVDARGIVERLNLRSFAEAADFMQDIRRRLVLAGGQTSLATIVGDEVDVREAGDFPLSWHARRPDETPPAAGRSVPRTAHQEEGERPSAATSPGRAGRARSTRGPGLR